MHQVENLIVNNSFYTTLDPEILSPIDPAVTLFK